MMIVALRKMIKRMHHPLEVMLTCVHWYAAWPSITPPCTAGPSRSCQWSAQCFAGANAWWARVGAWMRPTSKLPANGSTCTGPSIVMATRSISCFVPRQTVPLPGTFWSAPSICTVCPRRLPSTKAVRIRRLSRAFKPTPARTSRCARSSYLNNIVEQNHRAIKRVVRPMLGFKKFRCARALIAGIETMHMIRKGQLDVPEGQASYAASQFYSLAF